MSTVLFKNVINKLCLQLKYLIYIYLEDLSLNNLQKLICHKNPTNQPTNQLSPTVRAENYTKAIIFSKLRGAYDKFPDFFRMGT